MKILQGIAPNSPEWDELRLTGLEAYRANARIRIWNNSTITPYGCWHFNGFLDRDGYGMTKWYRRTLRAHRVSWTAYRGDIPAKIWVLHRCDIRACVNPDHLFLGTAQDNSSDMVQKGRANSGDNHWTRKYGGLGGARNGRAKLTHQNIQAIRASDLPSRALASAYEVHITTIQRVKKGTSWCE